MKIGITFILLAIGSFGGKKGDGWQTFDKRAFYVVMASGSIGGVDSVLSVLQHETLPEKEAYEGALLMKKAGLLGRPREKLTVFRTGAVKLETALAKDSSNGEYHFLRLIIQEHAPGIVHYHKDEEKDIQYIYRSFKLLSPEVQKAVLDYSKHSKLLRVKDLNG
jgi:hypothetical protein